MSEAPYQPQNADFPEPQKSSSSCMLYGCLGSVALVAVLVVCGGLSSYWFLKGQFEKYTSETAADLPVVELEEEQLAELEAEVEEFKAAVEADRRPQPLELTAEEINALIANDEDLRGRVYITIADGQISGDVSIPVGGRFFNGSATFDVKIVNDVLFVNLKDATVKGERLPQTFIDSLANENLAKDVNNNPEVAKLIKNLESITIEGDKIILTPKADDEPVDDPQPPVEADTPTTDADTPAEEADTPEVKADTPEVEADTPAVEV